ncbi:double-stranded RNA-binding protein 4-like isoform X2 [Gastrolobium bilobum]|uniref:double-stranded RNA-binding protein 4-like isoform X2 n=1 Tax=Gastrolobium bilobum TaxID=150636 RepID=UPI002AB0B063|nr:double-stranded RNA-binding protein 4-like isoform X2 [Gastrolobium bilobum]
MESFEVKMDGSTINFPHVDPTQGVVSSSSQPQTSISPEVPATDHHASSASAAAAAAQHLMYKNRLQEFTQRANLALPSYHTVNEGADHAPNFRSTVWVDGVSYTSQITFSHRKAAEQDAARVALGSHAEKIRDEGCHLVCEDTMFSKSILNEYASKLNLERPSYNTIKLEGLLPLFESSLVFNGTKYTGNAARNKKEAEQLAARAAILSILGTLYGIIKSKSRIYALVKPNKSQCIEASTASTMENTRHASISLDRKDKEVAGLVVAAINEAKIELPVPSEVLSSCQELPKHGSSFEATELPIVPYQPCSEQLIGDSSSLKKRRKNKKKANKKSRLESSLSIAASPLNEIPPCSVAQ